MKIRASSTYVYFSFVIGALLVGTLTTIEVPCPIDGGTGVITGAKGLEVKGVEGELVDFEFFDLGCGEIFNEYTYAVKISLVNETTTPIYGGIVLKFVDPDVALAVKRITRLELDGVVDLPSEAELLARYPGPPIMGTPIFVEIPAETAETIEEIMRFTGFGFEKMTYSIFVDMVKEIVCPYDGGAGKVPITEWLWIKANVQ